MKNLNVIHIANITKRTVNSKHPPGQSQTPLPMSSERLIPSPLCIVRDTPPILVSCEGPKPLVPVSTALRTLSLSPYRPRDHPQRSPPVGRSFLGRTPPCAMRSHPRTRHTRPPALLLCLFFVLSGCGVPRLFARVSSFHVLLTFLCFFICARKFFHFYFIDIKCVTNKRIFH